jgi:hypothetical protein
MSLQSIVKKAVTIADGITQSLQGNVTHIPWVGQDGDGTPHYGTPVIYKAIVDARQIERKTPDGSMVLTNAYILFLYPITPNGAVGRTEPIDPRDKIICPDGTSGVVAAANGFMDPTTSHPFFAEVWLTKFLIALKS